MPNKNYFKSMTTTTIVEGYVMMCGATLRVLPPEDGEFTNSKDIVRLSLFNSGRDDRTYWFNTSMLDMLIENLTEIRNVLKENNND